MLIMNLIMKRITIIRFFYLLSISAVCISCQKEVNYNGNLHILLKYNQLPVAGMKVYTNQGGMRKDSIGNLIYNELSTTDPEGSVRFYQLTPGTYYVYVNGYSHEAGKVVKADTTILIRKRYRAESNYEILLPVF